MTRPHRRLVPRPAVRRLRLREAALAVAAVAGGITGVAAPAHAAPSPLTASVVGEAPQGGGVFRFPQAVAVTAGGSRIFVGDQYSSVVQAFDGKGNFLFTIGSRGTRGEPGRLGVVGGVAVDKSAHLYVVDSENDRIQVFDANDGHFISTFGDKTSLNLMGGSAADGAGITAGGISVYQAGPGAIPIVYIADEGNDRVVKYVLDASSMQPVAAPVATDPSLGLDAPQGLAVDAANQFLYIADDDHHRIVKVTTDSLSFVGQGGGFGTGPGQLNFPYDIAIDASSPARLYVADNINGRVQVFNSTDLSFVSTFGYGGYGPGVGNLAIVRAVGALADAPGTPVYVADTANNKIQAFDGSGKVVAAWGTAGRGPGYVTRPGGVAFAPDGGITVADTFDQRVAMYAPDGTFTDQRGLVAPGINFAVPGSAPGQFQLPYDAEYDGNGNLWVSDSDNARVLMESPSGAVLATSGAGAFKDPRGMAQAPGGGMYVADRGDDTVSRMTADGAVTVLKTGLVNPVALGTDPSGATWVAEDRAIRNIATGTTIPSPENGRWDHPSGLAFAADGSLFVSERRPGTDNGARVVRGTPDGSGGFTWDRIAAEGDGTGQVVEPGGLAVNGAGTTLLVADTGNNRVLRFDGPGIQPPTTRTLNVSINDFTRGTVTSDLPGITCVTDCAQHYGGGRTVTLTAQPKSGYVLTGWSGDCAGAGTNLTCSVPMTQDRSTTVSFAPTGTGATAPAKTTVAALAVTRFSISPSTLHAARAANRRRGITSRKATHAKVRVALNRAAPLTVRVLIGKTGRKQGSQCKPLTRKNKSRKACTRYVAIAGHLSIKSTAKRTLTFTTRWNRRQLKPGSYELSITALDPSGVRIGPTLRHFRVTK